MGFADLVGFTTRSLALAPHELATMVNRFEALAYEHIPERGGRVVKTIGDEVMFATDDVGRGADIAIALVVAYAHDADVPEVRVGLASGPTLAWEGDLYGPTVNLASRLVNLARPNTVLISEELGQQLVDDPRFELRHLRPVNLRGIGRVRLWAACPPGEVMIPVGGSAACAGPCDRSKRWATRSASSRRRITAPSHFHLSRPGALALRLFGPWRSSGGWRR